MTSPWWRWRPSPRSTRAAPARARGSRSPVSARRRSGPSGPKRLLLGGGGDAALFAEAARVVSEGLGARQRPPRLGGLPPRSRRSADTPRAGPRLGARGTRSRVRPTRVVRVTVNGETYERLVEVRKSLADFLRQDLELTGTHLGCEHGVCRRLHRPPRRPARALVPALRRPARRRRAPDCRGARPGRRAPPDPGSLPGQLRAPVRLLHAGVSPDRLRPAATRSDPSREEIRRELAGNICRCTGYHAIVDAVEDAAARRAERPGDGEPESDSRRRWASR